MMMKLNDERWRSIRMESHWRLNCVTAGGPYKEHEFVGRFVFDFPHPPPHMLLLMVRLQCLLLQRLMRHLIHL